MHSIDIRDWRSASFYLVVVVLGAVGVILMVAPVVVGFMMSLTAGDTIQFPPQGFSLRWYQALFDPVQSGRIIKAGVTSLQIAALATTFTILFAVPAALGLASAQGRRFAFLEPFFMLPLVLPTLVYGIAALMYFSKIGISPSFSLVVLGHTVIFAPLVFRTTVAVVSQLSPTLTESSLILGASRAHTMRRITLPLIMPGILGGALLVFMASMDNVSVSLFLADARTNVLPIRMWRMIERVARRSRRRHLRRGDRRDLPDRGGGLVGRESGPEAKVAIPGPNDTRRWSPGLGTSQTRTRLRGTTVMNETTNLDRVSPKAEARSNRYSGRIEKLLDGFEPSFEFSAPPPLPEAEFAERVRRIRREAVLAGHDALIVHTGHGRLVPHLERLSALRLRLDARGRADHPDRQRQGDGPAVVLHPVGDHAAGRRAGRRRADLADRRDRARICRPPRLVDGQDRRGGCADILSGLGLAAGQIGRLGDRTSVELFG